VAVVREKQSRATRLSRGGCARRVAGAEAPRRRDSGTSRSRTTAASSMSVRIGTLAPAWRALRLLRARKNESLAVPEAGRDERVRVTLAVRDVNDGSASSDESGLGEIDPPLPTQELPVGSLLVA
jgi:hypothetical protein